MDSFWPWLPLLALSQALLTWRRTLGYLRYFQQEGYEAVRFLQWANVRSLTDPAFWAACITGLLAVWWPYPGAVVFMVAAVALALGQPDPRYSGKIPLRLTWRAVRVLSVSLVLAFAVWTWLANAFVRADIQAPLLASAFLLVLLPLVMIVANLLLVPYEQHTQRGYEAAAIRTLGEVRPQVIGITGSYGKSSSKAMLAHLLQFDAPTLAASGSINTLMGITRHIRENLVRGHRYLVVEMGAFKRGSIKRLCQLTPPSAGLITAVGDMHLERFGSTGAIVMAKGELADAIPAGGWLVVNADSAGALAIARKATHCRVLLYGEVSAEALATRIEEIRFTKHGTSFTLRTREASYHCVTPLLGRPIVLNLAGAFTLAVAMGVSPEVAVAAMRTLRPVSNRLEVVEEKGITWIRDAYNSNQFGFRAALEVAAALPVARRFLATPGCIELGAQQYDVNRALSREAAAVCDQTVVVAETNKDAFVAGHRDAGLEARLVPVPSRADAFRWIRETVKEGDLVILENDLPDLYERSAGLFWKERGSVPSAVRSAS
ncbi:MAG: UDP-N-acetylmuramoyl-tripeptide--D-alanyl-D-alanine ligase [Vicinamibacterales bacterium]